MVAASVLDETKRMQKQGMPEEEIIKILREKGVSHKDILEALSQSKIKEAVEKDPEEPIQEQPESYMDYETPSQYPQRNTGDYPKQIPPGMQQSIMNQPEENNSYNYPPGYYQEQNQNYQNPPASEYPSYDQFPQPQQVYPDYPPAPEQEQYPYPSTGLSPDIISEISEQIVAEKMAEIRKGVEKIIGMKTTMEAKIETLDDRLKRIEKIIDTLNTAVLRKVGDYVTNVSDLKKELIETQKTFSKLHSRKSSGKHKSARKKKE